MKFFHKHKIKPTPRPICQYSETEIHEYFVSKGTELYLSYGCSLKSEIVCMIKEKMCYLCMIHYKRLIQWQQETSPDLDLKCNSVFDLHQE
jgi:hypothetical protein